MGWASPIRLNSHQPAPTSDSVYLRRSGRRKIFDVWSSLTKYANPRTKNQTQVNPILRHSALKNKIRFAQSVTIVPPYVPNQRLSSARSTALQTNLTHLACKQNACKITTRLGPSQAQEISLLPLPPGLFPKP
jgi:hypothetical protein